MRKIKFMLLLFVVFCTPVLAALFFYQHPEKMPTMTTNQGTFVKPMIPIDSLRQLDSFDQENHGKKARLHLMLWEPKACTQSCQRILNKLLRVRTALGRRFYAVDERLLIGSVEANAPSLEGVIIQTLTSSERQVLKAAFNQAKILIADEQGRLILAYHPKAKPQAMYHDLTRLLNTSQA